jgi:PII-like signaling protein
MNGVQLRFYTYENRRHRGLLVYEWLLETARKQGIAGGSAFRAIAGFGRHQQLHEQHFFELAGEEPVLVEFVVEQAQAESLLAIIAAEGLGVFHARSPVEFGPVGGS